MLFQKVAPLSIVCVMFYTFMSLISVYYLCKPGCVFNMVRFFVWEQNHWISREWIFVSGTLVMGQTE